jgi:hypothetical protein
MVTDRTLSQEWIIRDLHRPLTLEVIAGPAAHVSMEVGVAWEVRKPDGFEHVSMLRFDLHADVRYCPSCEWLV